MSSQPGAGPAGGPAPTEEELRAAYEAELSRVNVTDMLAQVSVSLLNVAAFRMRPAAAAEAGQAAAQPSGEDLEQARDAIDGVRAVLEILERRIPSELGGLREALSQLQMAYAAQVRAAGPSEGAAGPAGGEQAAGRPQDAPGVPAAGQGGTGEGQAGPGPAESSGRLWVPGR